MPDTRDRQRNVSARERVPLTRRHRAARDDLPRLALPAVLPRRTVGNDDVFMHVASGAGRIVLQAARRYPFRRVVGIEASTELNTRARAQLAASRSRLRCQDVQLIEGEPAVMVVPEDVTIAFLNDPLRGQLFDLAVERLADVVERRDRGLRIVYVNPVEHERLVSRSGVMEGPAPRAWRLRLAGLESGWARTYQLWPSPLPTAVG